MNIQKKKMKQSDWIPQIRETISSKNRSRLHRRSESDSNLQMQSKNAIRVKSKNKIKSPASFIVDKQMIC